jgi:uncharacterized CHY-type Zn-finger protein
LLADVWGRPRPLPKIPLVDPTFLETTPWRKSYADMVRDGDELSDFSCYVCHDRKHPPPLRFDDKQNVIVADEHSDIVMGHGEHNRNNLCFNCHNDANLETLQARNGRALKFSESSQLCGSCHGPTYEDWEAGAHGRTSGYWNRSMGGIHRLDCVNCHNPHKPAIPTCKPAPGPHPLRGGGGF